jgi:hypothetical protein
MASFVSQNMYFWLAVYRILMIKGQGPALNLGTLVSLPCSTATDGVLHAASEIDQNVY